MPLNLEKALQGTREEALTGIEETEKLLSRYAVMPDAETARNKRITCAYSVLRCIYLAEQKTQCKQRDICCNILENILAPHIIPSVDVKMWSNISNICRSYHYLLMSAKYFVESSVVYKFLKSRENCIQNEDVYKSMLGTYCQHLLLQNSRAKSDEGKKQIACILHSMTALFNEMRNAHEQHDFQYADLITEVLTNLMPKRSASIFTYLSSMPDLAQTFDAFFTLLAAIKVPAQMTEQQMQVLTDQHVELLYTLVQFDVRDKLNKQLALAYLKVCRKLTLWQRDKVMAQMFHLMFYYVDCVYKRETKNYGEICAKFKSFFEKCKQNSSVLHSVVDNKAFMALVEILHGFFVNMQQSADKSSTPFDGFWQQMNDTQAYVAHMQFLIAYMSIASFIKENKFEPFKCCTSTRKHIIVNVVITAMSSYTAFLAFAKDAQVRPLKSSVLELQHLMSTIVCYGINVIETHACPDMESRHRKLFAYRFMQVAADLCNESQSCGPFKAIVKDMPKLAQKLGDEEWQYLLRRTSRLPMKSHNSLVLCEVNSLYAATLLCHFKNQHLVRNHIGVFYSNPPPLQAKHVKCLSLYYAESAFPALPSHQKRALLWHEVQYIAKYERSNVELKSSLLGCTNTPQDYMYVVCAFKLYTEATLPRVLEISLTLNAKRANGEQLNRMELLKLAQSSCALLMSETDADKQIHMSVESKECREDGLKELMRRPEMMSITVSNELRRINLALTAIEAYEQFYEKADDEPLNLDECFLEWELIVDDLRYMALYLQYAGYNEHSTRAWLLHYKICCTLLDTCNQWRGLAFFCEHTEFFVNNVETLNLQEEIEKQLLPLSVAVTSLPNMPKQEQTIVLICFCQLAYYYARARNFGYAQMLLQLVAQKHEQLPERKGKYDIVSATRDAVGFRIMWKQLSIEKTKEVNSMQWQNRCLMGEIEGILNRFRDFEYISTTDVSPYMILMMNLTLQVSECTSNRLCDNLAYYFAPNALKVSLQKGSALRVLQILTFWMWANLQSEHVQDAQVKLQIIECVLGTKTWNEVSHTDKKEQQLVAKTYENSIISEHTGSMEMLRRVANAQEDISMSLKNNQHTLKDSTTNEDLHRFFDLKYVNDNNGDIFRWCSFVVGCLNARLHYISGNYSELADFYAKCQLWLEGEKSKRNTIVSITFQNFELLNYVHHVNYLRATRKFETAKKVAQGGIKLCSQLEGSVDILYSINLPLQLGSIELAVVEEAQSLQKIEPPKIRRVLKFTTTSPEGTIDGNVHGEKLVKPAVRTVEKSAVKKVEPLLLVNARIPRNKPPAFTIYSGEEISETPKTTKTPKPTIATKTPKPTVATKTPNPTIATKTPNLTIATKTPKPTIETKTPKLTNCASASASFKYSTSQDSADDKSVDLNCCQIIEINTSSEFDDKEVEETKENKKSQVSKTKTITKNVDKIKNHNSSLIIIDLDSPATKRPLQPLKQRKQPLQQQSEKDLPKVLKDLDTPVSHMSAPRALRTRAVRTRQNL